MNNTLKKILNPFTATGFVLKVMLVVILCPVLPTLIAVGGTLYLLYGFVTLPFRPLIVWLKNRK